MYHFGKNGVIRDIRKAMQWYKKSADQGYAPAQLGLGVIYDIGPMGYDVQNYQMAFHWYSEAAKLGNAPALMNLGILYENGRGVRQNLFTAKSYFGQSCDKGLQLGCDLYKRLNEKGVK